MTDNDKRAAAIAALGGIEQARALLRSIVGDEPPMPGADKLVLADAASRAIATLALDSLGAEPWPAAADAARDGDETLRRSLRLVFDASRMLHAPHAAVPVEQLKWCNVIEWVVYLLVERALEVRP
jgi:hypothetical protein